MATIGNLWINIKANTKSLQRGVGGAKNSLAAFGKFMMNPAVLGIAVLTVAIVAWVKLGKAIVSGLKSAVQESMKFNQSMAKVGAVTMSTGKDFDLMRKKALELGRTSVFTADQVAGGQLALAKAGLTSSEVNETIEATAHLAAAADMDLAEASGVVVNAMRAFNLTAEDTTHIADVFALTMSRSNTTVLEHADALAYVAPVARSLGFSLEHTSAMIGVLADSGIKGSMAGTGLRRVMSALATEIETHGVQALDNWITAGHTVSEDLLKFGLRGFNVTQVLALMRKKMLALGQETLTASDIVKKMAEMRMDTLEGDFIKLKSAVSGLKIVVGDELEPVIRQVVQISTHAVNAITAGFVEWVKSADDVELSMKDLELIVRGIFIGTQMAIQSMIQLFNEQIREARILLNIGQVIANAIELISELASGSFVGTGMEFKDIVTDLKDIGDTVQKGWFGKPNESIDKLFEEIIKAFDSGTKELDEKVKAFSDKSGNQFLESLGLTSKGLAQMDEATAKILDKMSTWRDKLDDEWLFAGWEKWEIDADKAIEVLEKMGGETKAIAEIWEMIDFKNHMDDLLKVEAQMEKMKDEAQSIFESVMTPFEKLESEKANLSKLFAEGVLSDETYNRALKKLEKTLEDSEAKVKLGVDEKAIQKGFTVGLQTAMGTVKIAGEVNRTEQLAQKSLQVQENMNRLNEAMVGNTKSTSDALAGTVKTDVDGLKEKITSALSNATITASITTATLEGVIKDGNEILRGGFMAVVNEVKNISNETTSPLT
jgi:hypothetical protein